MAGGTARTMNAIIERCRLAGIRLWVEGDAIRYDAPKGAMTPELITDLKAHKPDIVKALGQPTPSKRRGLDGYGTPPGAAPLGDTVMARQMRSIQEASDEAEAIRELFVATGRILVGLAVMSRSEAVLEAGRIAGPLARNRRYRWTSLRTALEGYPELLARVPDRDGVVDSLVFGLATVAVLKDRHVLRQGEFAGAQEAQT
jgi:hypothetical protein